MNEQQQKEFDSLKTEIALFQLNQMKKNATVESILKLLEEWGKPEVEALKNRVKILEEARQRQIELNGEYDKRIDELEKPKSTIDKPKFRWW